MVTWPGLGLLGGDQTKEKASAKKLNASQGEHLSNGSFVSFQEVSIPLVEHFGGMENNQG